MQPCDWKVDYRSCKRHWDICVKDGILGIVAKEAGSFGELVNLLTCGSIGGVVADGVRRSDRKRHLY